MAESPITPSSGNSKLSVQPNWVMKLELSVVSSVPLVYFPRYTSLVFARIESFTLIVEDVANDVSVLAVMMSWSAIMLLPTVSVVSSHCENVRMAVAANIKHGSFFINF